MLNLQDAFKEARVKSQDLTFFVKDCEFKTSEKSNNTGARVTTGGGKVITFWSSNMEDVVELIDAKTGQYCVAAGVRIAEDGGLIPANAEKGGFWNK